MGNLVKYVGRGRYGMDRPRGYTQPSRNLGGQDGNERCLRRYPGGLRFRWHIIRGRVIGYLQIANFDPFSGPNSAYRPYHEQAGCVTAVNLINAAGAVPATN